MSKKIKNKLVGKSSKIQSAMEYLMTYGWAILIVSIVLGALFQLGVFDPGFFAPKASPGSCSVFRPNGPGNNQYVNLRGTCNLLPKFVASFNGQTSYIAIPPDGVLFAGKKQLSALGWIFPYAFNQDTDYSTIITKANSYYFHVDGSGSICLFIYGVNSQPPDVYFCSTGKISLNQWYAVAFVFDGSNEKIYINGVLDSTKAISGTITDPGCCNSYLGIGANLGSDGKLYGSPFNRRFNGYEADMQLYNSSLTDAQVTFLYSEGIGGAPLDLQHLVGWWPLNGDSIDYSANGNNGQINSVTFTGQWLRGYSHS